jgi:hypothetical protein
MKASLFLLLKVVSSSVQKYCCFINTRKLIDMVLGNNIRKKRSQDLKIPFGLRDDVRRMHEKIYCQSYK